MISNRGLGAQHHGVVGLAHISIQYALKEARSISKGDKHQVFALSAKSMDPPIDHNSLPTQRFQAPNLLTNRFGQGRIFGNGDFFGFFGLFLLGLEGFGFLFELLGRLSHLLLPQFGHFLDLRLGHHIVQLAWIKLRLCDQRISSLNP